MHKTQSEFNFKVMTILFRMRDFFLPRERILDEVGIKRGFYALDFGSGSGSYIYPLWKFVGESGKIYALDKNPLALIAIRKIVEKRGLNNVVPIHAETNTGLPDGHLDVVLLYDTLHTLSNQLAVLLEIHRVLKPEGILSVSDHHMKRQMIISSICEERLFTLSRENRYTLTFMKGD